MSITLQTYITINEKFKKIIQSGNYERLIYSLLNVSAKLFPNEFEYIESQSCGECDFVDKKTGEKYDAKLPITTQQGKWIGSKQVDYKKWIESMLDECSEFAEKMIQKRGQHSIEELVLYQTLKQIIQKEKADEHIIFFFPFPIVYESSVGIYGQFASDILSTIYDGLQQSSTIKEQKIYAIYPSIDELIIIRNLANGAREYCKRKTYWRLVVGSSV